MAKPSGARSERSDFAGVGGCVNLGATENDDDAFSGSAAGIYKHHDAVDDAYNVGSVEHGIPQRSCTVLDSVELGWNRDSIFYNRMGAII